MASQGPLSPLIAIDDAGIGTVTWTDPDYAQLPGEDDSGQATVTLQSQASHYLKATNFGFSIPTGRTILGIECEYRTTYHVNSGSAGSITRSSRIVKGGAIGTTAPSPSFTTQQDNLQYSSSGSSSYLWGETWTAEDINAADFGTTVRFVEGSGANITFSVDHIRITVTYQLAETIAMTTKAISFTKTNTGTAYNQSIPMVTKSLSFSKENIDINYSHLERGSMLSLLF